MRFSILSAIRGLCFLTKNGFTRPWYWSFYSAASRKMVKPFRYYRRHLHGHPAAWDLSDSPFSEVCDFFNDCSPDAIQEPNNEIVNGAAEKAWNWILEEIDFALDYAAWESEFEFIEIPNPQYDEDYTHDVDGRFAEEDNFIPVDGTEEAFKLSRECIAAKRDPRYGKMKEDTDTEKQIQERARRGFALMGRYWLHLWD